MFKKVHHVSLVNESEQDEDEFEAHAESDQTILISEDEMTKENAQARGTEEEGFGTLSSGGTGMQRRWNWKFWRRERRYELNHAASDVRPVETVGRKVTLCGRSFHLCKINSWKAIFLVLFVFSVSITLAVIVSKLAAEPPEDSTDPPTRQGTDRSKSYHIELTPQLFHKTGFNL